MNGMNVIVYDPPRRIDQLAEDVTDNVTPVDAALLEASRISAAEELRKLVKKAAAEGSFAISLGSLLARADYLDPEGAAPTCTCDKALMKPGWHDKSCPIGASHDVLAEIAEVSTWDGPEGATR